MKKETNIKWWEKVLADAPKSYIDWFEKEKAFLRKNITKNSNVLEVGCGEGRSLNYITDITKNIIGIDNDKKAINDAKNNLRGIKFQVADGKKLPFDDNSFDFVICMTTPANFGEEKQKFYGEMRRVLKKEGQILLSVFNENAMEERLNLYKKLKTPIKEVINGRVIFDKSVGIKFSDQFSKEELEEIFREAKLEIIEITKEGIGYFCRLKQ